MTLVRRTYLFMDERPARPPIPLPDGVNIARVTDMPASFFRYLYREVGRGLHWEDRLDWSDATIRTHLGEPGEAFHVMYVQAAPAGYVELRRGSPLPGHLAEAPRRSAAAAVNIDYFGLLPEYHGRGLGKALLERAIDAAWSLGATAAADPYIWLHTCTLDGPAALPNYLRRGFRAIATEDYEHACVASPGQALGSPFRGTPVPQVW